MKLQVRGYRLPTHPLESIFTQVHSQEQNSGFCQAVISSPNMHGKRSNRRVIFKRFASVLTCWKRLIFLATAGGMSCSHWELRWNGIHKSELSSWRVLHKFGKVFYENKQKHGLNLYLYPWMYVETKHKSKDLVRYDQTMVSCLHGVGLILGDWQLRWYHAIAGCFVNIWYRVAFISFGNQSWFTVAILFQLVLLSVYWTRATVFTNQMQGSSRSHLSLARFPTLQVLHYVFILNSHWLFRFRIGCIGYFDFALLKWKSLDLVYG